MPRLDEEFGGSLSSALGGSLSSAEGPSRGPCDQLLDLARAAALLRARCQVAAPRDPWPVLAPHRGRSTCGAPRTAVTRHWPRRRATQPNVNENKLGARVEELDRQVLTCEP